MTDSSVPDSVAIIGGSLAGVRCATQLRRSGFEGQLTIVNAETVAPYDRPPLSKQFLSGEWDVEKLALLRDDQLAEVDARWYNDTRATSLDVDAKTVALDNGESLTADAVVISTGASPRHLPVTADLSGVHELRSQSDAQDLRAELSGEPR